MNIGDDRDLEFEIVRPIAEPRRVLGEDKR